MPGRASWIVGPVVALLLASACRTNKPADPDTRTEVAITPVSPGHVDPKFESAWQKVREASERDPASPAVVAAADSLLSQDPPLNLRIAAIHAKVAHAYLNRMDPAAIQMADQAIAAASGQPLDGGEGMVDDLARLRALARARGGDPGLALQELRGLLERGRIAEREWIAASAIAYGRAGAQGEAALAHARWRERVADRSPEAEYCDRRLSELLRGLDRQTLETLARRVSGTDAALCLLASAGHPLPGDVAAWVTRCRPRSAAIGVLLPRTGRFAGLADPQLAAATAAVRVLSRHQGSGVSVLWEDSGSTAEQTREATRQILAEGVEVIVGPVGPQNVRAAVEVSGAAGMLILPGEGADDARGVAPSLEDRGAALARHALAAHAPTVIVLSPEGEYGKRVAAGVQGVVQESASNALKLIRYPSSTTSFKAILDPILSSLRGGAWLIVADQISRTELVLRQLGREGLTIAKANGAGVVVMATGEGIAAASSVLEGVWVAPAAWETEDVRDAMFAAEYQGQEGVLPGDQAWLVWRALALAWQGPQAADVPKSAEPRIYRVQGGQLVEHRPKQAEAAIIRPPE